VTAPMPFSMMSRLGARNVGYPHPIDPQVNQEKPDGGGQFINDHFFNNYLREVDAVAAPQIGFGDSWDRYFTGVRNDSDCNLQWWKVNEFNYPDPACWPFQALRLMSSDCFRKAEIPSVYGGWQWTQTL
jgi:hypothetical protein